MIKLIQDHKLSMDVRPVFVRPNGWVVPYPAGLKQLRKERGWKTVGPVAEITGASPRTVESWEQGRHMPTKPALLLLMAALDKLDKEVSR